MTGANTGEETYTEEDIQIPVRDGSTIAVRIHKPKNLPKDGCPVFVVYHGGGFCLGGLDNEQLLCRNFTALGGIAVNVDYRLAPENPFPVPIEDAYDALKWVCTLSYLTASMPANRSDCKKLLKAWRQCSKRIPRWRHQRWSKFQFDSITPLPR